MAESDPSRENPFFHDAFISYSRKDTPYAATLERALKRYSPPKDLPAPQRRLNIFRDTEDFTGTEYFTSVERHLQGSRKLIVICSPNARRSDFVNDEIRRFAQSHAAADIIPILVAGIPNNEAKSNDDTDMAFPAALAQRLEVPLASDYRSFNPKSDNPTSGNYRQAWFKLLADIYGCTRAEVEQREQRRRARQRIQWVGASAAIALALGVSLYIAQSQRWNAKSNELADQAIQLADGDPEHALQLARDAVDQSATKLSTSALRVALAKMPDLLIPLAFHTAPQEGDSRDPVALAFTPDGRHIAVADAEPRILELETGRTAVKFEVQGTPIKGLRFAPDGVRLAAIDENHNTIVFDAATGKPQTKIKGELHWRQPGAGGAQQAVVLSDKSVQIDELDNAGAWRSLGELIPRDYIGPATEPYDSSSRELSPDGRRIASLVAHDDTARLIVTDLDSGQAVSRELRSPSGLNKLSWSPNGSYIVAAALTGFVVVETRSLQNLVHNDTGSEITVEDVSFSPNEKLLASTDRGGTTSLWDIEKSKKVAELSGSPTRAYDPIFASSGDLVSVRYADNRVYLFTIDDAARASDFVSATEPMVIFDPIWGGAKAAKFTRDGGALVIEYENNRMAIWKTGRWRPERSLPLKYDARYEAGKPEGLRDVRMTTDNSAVGVRRAGAWRGWSVISGDEVSVNDDVLKPLDKVTLSEIGGLQFRTDNNDDTAIYLVDRSTERQRYPLKHNATVMSKTFSPDGNCILTTSRFLMASGGPPDRADVARLWDTETGTLLREWKFGYGNPDSAFFAGRDRFVVLSAGNAFVYRTPLCQPLDVLIQLPATRVSSESTAKDRAGAGFASSEPSAQAPSSSPPQILTSAQDTPAPAPAARAQKPPHDTNGAPMPTPAEEEPKPKRDIPAAPVAAPGTLRKPQQDSPLPPLQTANAPSFSCSGSLSSVEAIICKDPELTKLDVELARSYQTVMTALQNEQKRKLMLEQRDWIKKRAACANNAAMKQCVEDAFRRRLSTLQSRYGSGMK